MNKTPHGQKMCRHLKSHVLDSRDEGDNNARYAEFSYIKCRRRKCLSCGYRFNTFELTMAQIERWSDGVTSRSDNLLSSLRKLLEDHNETSIKFDNEATL